MFDNFGHEWNVSFSVRATKLLAYIFAVERMRNPVIVTVCVIRLGKFEAMRVGDYPKSNLLTLKVTNEIFLSL